MPIVKFARIRFPDRESRILGIHQLMQKTRVVCLANEEYIVAKTALSILEKKGIAFEIICETNLDETLADLKDSAAPLFA